MTDTRKAFFDYIRERRSLLEHVHQKPFVNIVTPEHLWTFLDYVGNFLLESGMITHKDFEIARGMAEDYEERVRSVLHPDSSGGVD